MKANTIIKSFVLIVFPIVSISGRAQGAFQNLNFESANIPNSTQPGPVATTSALPGWSVFYGSSQQSQIFYNDASLGASQVTLVSSNNPYGPNATEGNFGAFLQGGSTATDASIRQTGLVPALTASILFKANSMGPMSLSLGGQNIAFVALSTGANFTLYGGNIPSALAGQVEQLEFSVPEGLGGNNGWNLDSIVFSQTSVPEPATWALLLCSAGLLRIKQWKQKT